MVAMSEDCGEEGGSDADQRVCHSLPEDVWVEILARTPASSLRLTSCVCKRWRHLAQSPTFLALHTERHEHQKSWLYVNSTRYRTTQDSSPPSELEESFTTHPVPFALPEEHISCGPGAIFYKFSETPSTHQKLLYRIGSLAKEWREAPELKHPRTTPVVGVVKVPGLNGAHKVVCMGGNLSLKVEVFSSESKVWEEGEDMPIEFQGKATFKSIAAAVCKQKMYVYHMYSGFVASYDVERRSWSSVKCLRPPGTQYCYLSVHNGELLLIGVSYEDEAFVFRGWRLDGSSMESRGKSTNVTFDLLGHSFHLHDHL